MPDAPLSDREFVAYHSKRPRLALTTEEWERLNVLAGDPLVPYKKDTLTAFATLRLDLAEANKRIAELEQSRDEARETLGKVREAYLIPQVQAERLALYNSCPELVAALDALLSPGAATMPEVWRRVYSTRSAWRK